MELNNTQDDREEMNGSMNGAVLQVTTRFDHKYEYDIKIAQVNNSNGKPEYVLSGGYAVDVFFYLQSLLRFNYTLRPDVHPTKFDKESVENASVDLYLASYSLLPDRAKYLEPTFVIGQSRIAAFMDHFYEADSANQNLFITPFTTNLWISVLAMLFVFIISLLIFSYFEDQHNVMGISDMIFYCISMSLSKGSDNPFFGNSTRIASTILSFAIVIIMASYSGIMTSIFAVNRYAINSIETLVHSNYRMMMEYGFSTNDSTIKYMLQQLTHIPSVIELLKKAEKSNFVFTTFPDAVKEVKRGPSAYIIDEETAMDAISEVWGGFPCKWEKISVFNLRYPWVMYMRKKAVFQRAINSGIVRIKERGILNRIRKKWISQPTSSCLAGSDGSYKSITYSQVESAFKAFLILTFAICPALFFAEKCYAIIKFECIRHKNRVVTASKESVISFADFRWYK